MMSETPVNGVPGHHTAPLAGIEPRTLGIRGLCSIQLSYGRQRAIVHPGRVAVPDLGALDWENLSSGQTPTEMTGAPKRFASVAGRARGAGPEGDAGTATASDSREPTPMSFAIDGVPARCHRALHAGSLVLRGSPPPRAG